MMSSHCLPAEFRLVTERAEDLQPFVDALQATHDRAKEEAVEAIGEIEEARAATIRHGVG